jgi:hypothetical protein
MKDEQHDDPHPDPRFDAPFDASFDALMRDAARTYNRPRELPDADALWAAIDRALPPAGAGQPAAPERPALTVLRGDAAPPRPARRGAPLWKNPWLRTAAGLLLGVALGRASVRPATSAERPAPAVASAAADAAPAGTDLLPDETTTAYLGRAEALLAALPEELRTRRADPGYQSRADALLLQTRLLLDSPAAADPTLRSLFDDLEVVLAQVVRLRADRDPTRIDFLNQALEQRDVLPRLRDAVADNAVADNAAN